MEQTRPYPCVTITKKGERALRGGHPWVYEGELLQAGPCEDGGICDVRSEKGAFLGAGFYNSQSKIRVRVLSSNANDRFDDAFFARRVRYAVELRRAVMGADFSACRLIFGEADGLPGLTADRFGDILVCESLCLGTDRRKGAIYAALIGALAAGGDRIAALYERNEGRLREKEGLPREKGFFAADGLAADLSGHTEICENGIFYDVDYINGQKTGFFLDQKYNRRAAAKLAAGRRVADICTHTGAFALNCAAAGAQAVTAVDVSQAALDEAARNAARNGLSDKLSFVCADAFDFLASLPQRDASPFDYIILDPPAFAKSRANIPNALRGYRELNAAAMRRLPRGGFLTTCSCSHFVDDAMFRAMLQGAAADAAVSLKLLEYRQQAPDHPVLWSVPETDYLKCYLLQVC